MKKLLLVLPFALAACADGPLTKDASLFYIPAEKGAGLGPYTLAEYEARLADGQGGLARIQEPWTRADALRRR
ncbi:MAG: hypothetical protein AAGA08_11870 [Pseudomonadota bacterium]